jgi:DNA modification methylase
MRPTPSAKSSVRGLHPFPARMAPEIALDRVRKLSTGSVVLDPMAGSGTVISAAIAFGHKAIGFDLDPLAVLMASVATSKAKPAQIVDYGKLIAEASRSLHIKEGELPWIDSDSETSKFIQFWFAPEQIAALRAISSFITINESNGAPTNVVDALKLALSRLIITKKKGASLAWDVSHSRPHRAKVSNEFQVIDEFARSCVSVATYLSQREPSAGSAKVRVGDARILKGVEDGSVDLIITSPPYLNAIDYMRGHKLALVWLGYSIRELREIRSISIGAERALLDQNINEHGQKVFESLGSIHELPMNTQRMIKRYSNDLVELSRSARRVLRRGGEALVVVGDSCLRGVQVSNSRATIAAAEIAGLTLKSTFQREIPQNRRYLPISDGANGALAKRMLVENVLTFRSG